MYAAGNSRTSIPRPFSQRAQWCAEPHASITTRPTLRLTNQRSNWVRVRRWDSTTRQDPSATASWNTDLARSTPTIGEAAVAFMLDSSWLIADTPHHMRPAGTMMPKYQGESIPSVDRAGRFVPSFWGASAWRASSLQRHVQGDAGAGH